MDSLPRRRWYDKEEACRQLLETIHEIQHQQVREFCGRVLIHFAERIQDDMHEKAKKNLYLRSLGEENVASLYRFGRQKNRWYDYNEVLYKAVSELYRLPVPALTVIGFKLGDTFNLIRIYCKVCVEVGQPPLVENMTLICTTALQAGTEEARAVLIQAVGQELFDAINQGE